jgi:ABC-type polysaccharide/polyol phosphate transport system ATPase subunit
VIDYVSPEILLLDEVHEAVDHEFREVVRAKARATLQSGGIVIAAGHDHGVLEQLCPRAVLLAEGGLPADGAFGDILELYFAEKTVQEVA